MSRPLATADILATVDALVTVSRADLLYTDHYLNRAEALLTSICTRAQYLTLQRAQEQLPQIRQSLRSAAERDDWVEVRALAGRAAVSRDAVGGSQRLLQTADPIYGPRVLHVDPTTLALAGVLAQPAPALAIERERMLSQLRLLLVADAEDAAFYRTRLAHFEALQVVTEEPAGTGLGIAESRKQILQAAESGDFERVQRLVEAITTAQRDSYRGRLRLPRPVDLHAQQLVAILPEAAVRRARELGLSPETLAENGALNAYLSCACAEQFTFPSTPLTAMQREAQTGTCGHPCPPEVDATLRENLDLLIVHPFISSAGLRYLPWFGRETVLVETFPEQQPDARSGVLELLGLPARRGLSRVRIEDAVLTNMSAVCRELGLDPLTYAVVCIPFDVYLRLAPKYGWGREELWTHVDGYQVMRDLALWALVGGNACYGGPDDLSSLGRSYDSDHLTVRFAVVRRERFLIRATPVNDVATHDEADESSQQ
jgi:hypothetical protein